MKDNIDGACKDVDKEFKQTLEINTLRDQYNFLIHSHSELENKYNSLAVQVKSMDDSIWSRLVRIGDKQTLLHEDLKNFNTRVSKAENRMCFLWQIFLGLSALTLYILYIVKFK